MTRHAAISLLACCLLSAVLFVAGLLVGGVWVDPSAVWGAIAGTQDSLTYFIIVENRIPALTTALLSGAALSVAGLLMQTCFNNPLAGPSIMGVSTGASVGVAIVMMALGAVAGVGGRLAIVGGAFGGAAAIIGILVLFSGLVRSSNVLLIVGILLGYLSSSVVSMLNYFSSDSSVHRFVVWGMGSFSGVAPESLPLFAFLTIAFIVLCVPYCKQLNALLLGERYAESTGVAIQRTRTGILMLSGALTAVVTAWCGPIGFIGLVVPHIARMLGATANHRVLLPLTAASGAAVGLICQILSMAPSAFTGSLLPVNAITPVIGVPIIIYVLLNRNKLVYFS